MLQGLPANPVNLSVNAATATAFRPGQVFQTVVQGGAGDAFLLLQANRIPLESNTLTAGQAVRVEVLPGANTLQLRVTPLNPATPPVGTPGNALEQLVGHVLQTLQSEASASDATRLLPAALPATASAIRQLLAVFVSRGNLASDLHDLAGLLQQASADGALTPQTLASFTALVGQFNAAESQDFKQLLRQLQSGQSLEARLARALEAGNLTTALRGAQEDLRTLLAGLRGNEMVLAYFRGKGVLRRFEQSLQQVTERLTGVDLQNLRGHEQAYAFWELPLPPEAPIRHAQVHLFGEGKNRRSSIDRENATVVLDLSTTKLGDLWITLQFHEHRRLCTFRVTNPAAAAELEANANELIAALEGIGYPNTRVQTITWDGDRLRAAADLMSRFQGVSMDA